MPQADPGGYAVAYAADAKVIHSHNYSCMQQFHRNFDLGVSQAEHPEVFEGIKSESEGIKLVKQTAAHLFSALRPQNESRPFPQKQENQTISLP